MGHTNKINSKMNKEDFCLVDSSTTHTILKDKKYFQSLILCKVNFNTISTSLNLIESSGRAIIMLPKGTKLCINDLCILLNQEEIYLVLRIYVIMVIILKPITKVVKNFFILLQ